MIEWLLAVVIYFLVGIVTCALAARYDKSMAHHADRNDSDRAGMKAWIALWPICLLMILFCNIGKTAIWIVNKIEDGLDEVLGE